MRNEVVCLCSAYWFPHRLSGGKCSGAEWAESYYLMHGNLECVTCNCNSHGGCDVANGKEDIEHCEAYNNQLHYDTGIRLPIDLEDIVL